MQACNVGLGLVLGMGLVLGVSDGVRMNTFYFLSLCQPTEARIPQACNLPIT